MDRLRAALDSSLNRLECAHRGGQTTTWTGGGLFRPGLWCQTRTFSHGSGGPAHGAAKYDANVCASALPTRWYFGRRGSSALFFSPTLGSRRAWAITAADGVFARTRHAVALVCCRRGHVAHSQRYTYFSRPFCCIPYYEHMAYIASCWTLRAVTKPRQAGINQRARRTARRSLRTRCPSVAWRAVVLERRASSKTRGIACGLCGKIATPVAVRGLPRAHEKAT